MSSQPAPKSGRGTRRGPLWYWGSRLGLSLASVALVVFLLEASVTGIWGTIYYPLPGVQDAAEYLYFTLPERFNPLFHLGEEVEGERRRFHTDKRLHEGDWFFARKQSFSGQRSATGLRVAFMGGSSVQGWPYRGDGVVFAELVGEKLRAAHPDVEIDVINAGVGTYSSFQLVDIADQLELFNPDIVVVYAGHNDQGYYFFHRTFLDTLAPASSAEHFLNRFSFYQGARMLRDRLLENSKPEHLGNSDGVAFIPQDENIQDIGVERYISFVRIQQQYLPQIFRRNLTEVVERLQDEDTSVILASPASNLRDFPPVFSMHFEPISNRKDKRFRALLDEADELMRQAFVDARRMPSIEGNGERMRGADPWGPAPPAEPPPLGSGEAIAACAPALELLRSAEAISDTYALLHFLKGTCLIHSDAEAAHRSFIKARDLSPAMAPFQRASSELTQVVAEVAAATGVPVVDVQAKIAARSELGIPEGRFFVDNIHFSAAGHREVTEALLVELQKRPVLVDGPLHRQPDPPAEQTWKSLKLRSQEFTWGLGLTVPGAGMPVVGNDEPASEDEPAASGDDDSAQ